MAHATTPSKSHVDFSSMIDGSFGASDSGLTVALPLLSCATAGSRRTQICAGPAVVTGCPDPHAEIAGTYLIAYPGSPGPASVNTARSVQGPVVTCTPFSRACACDVAGAWYCSALGGPGGGGAHDTAGVDACAAGLCATAGVCAPAVGVAAFFELPPHAASIAAAANAHIAPRIGDSLLIRLKPRLTPRPAAAR
jgi:hypothetical protein